MSAIQAFKMDPSTEWVIKSAPGFVAIKPKMGCPICDASASHYMAAKRSYEIRLNEKEVSHAVAEAWPELVRYQDDYYRLLEDHNTLKETTRSTEKRVEEPTIKNLDDQVHSLEAKLQAIKGNSHKLPNHEDLILENKCLQQELDYYVGRAQHALYGKDTNWVARNGYCISDIPASDREDNDEDQSGKSNRNNYKVVPEAGIPAIGGSHLPHTQKRIIADPPASIAGVLPKPLAHAQGCASDWVMERDIHDSEMCRLYIEGRALQPHLRSPDHTAVIFHIDEYARSLLGLPQNLVVHHDDPSWMINLIQAFNVNPSRIPQSLCLKGLHVNINDAFVWYWLNLIKPKFCGAEAEVLLQSIFPLPTPARYQINCNQKFDRHAFTYWLGCDTRVVTPALARDKLEPYFVCHVTKTIWNEVTLRSQLRGNEIASLKGGIMNQFLVHDDLLPLERESPYYFPPSVGEPMDQDETDPGSNLIQHTAGSSSLANRLDYGEGGSFSHPPADAHELRAQISYYNSLVPQAMAHESIAEITEALTRNMYTDNLE
ncbi:hypothetical protein M422DRAFT_256378 [Sphaerobolus stellatus SS14]|uniref:Uncharacterized protein n=1 Tax=Sphaerobolus stellatus (strain SS14) TaxID=990650 RepID=A0A0C9UC38_SPHS4|nr:hypothetical protein M422DRAFT_256378 [Sphaerobolus stellatus SS14]